MCARGRGRASGKCDLDLSVSMFVERRILNNVRLEELWMWRGKSGNERL